MKAKTSVESSGFWQTVLGSTLMRLVIIVIGVFVFGTKVSADTGSSEATKVKSDARPNVLFIAVDDLNDWIGCLKGHPQARTPNMDRLASRGVLFANAHCAAPACNPSRAAVFTGLTPYVTNVWSNQSGSINKKYPEALHLQEAFSEAGYKTLGTGKLLHSNSKSRFDEFFSTHQRWSPFSKDAVKYTEDELPTKKSADPRHVLKDSQGRAVVLPLNRMPSDRKPNQKDGESFDWGPFDVPDLDFGDTQITDWAIKKLKSAADEPIFLGVGYYRPHIPLYAPKRFFERFKNERAQLPPTMKNDLDDIGELGQQWAREAITAGSHSTTVKYKQWQAAVEAYLACTTYVDSEIGRLLDALDASDISDNTIVVLWSDHGWHLGEKEHWGKWTGWERSTRVPLMIVPPKNQADKYSKAGQQCDQAVGLIDLYPTLLEMAGIKRATAKEGKQADPLAGVSLVPLLKDPASKTNRAVVTTFDQGNSTIRTHRWRFIRYVDGSEELYDLKADPNEWKNLAGLEEQQNIQATLSRQLELSCLEPTQMSWYAKYSKQKNAPKLDTMLLNTDNEPGLKRGFEPLFNGTDLSGWTAKGGTCEFEARDGCIVGTCVPGSSSTYLCTDANDFADFVFTCDMKWEADGNSGVMFRSDTKPGKKGEVTVFGPQAEMEGFSKDRGWSGAIYGQSCGGMFYPLWHKQHQDARQALKKDEWNRLTIFAEGNVIKTWVNGVPCAHWHDDGTYAKGFFGLQIHKGSQGTVLWRNLQIKKN